MPRRSRASYEVTPVAEPEPIPAPPGNFTAEHVALWQSIVVSKEPGWFDAASLPLLGALVRHTISFEHISIELEKFNVSDADHLTHIGKLTKLRDVESKNMVSISTRLRLTVQARYTPASAALVAQRGGRVKRLWDRMEDNQFFQNGKRQ